MSTDYDTQSEMEDAEMQIDSLESDICDLKMDNDSLREENKRLYSLLGSLSNVKTGDETIFEWLDNRDLTQQERGAKIERERIRLEVYKQMSKGKQYPLYLFEIEKILDNK